MRHSMSANKAREIATVAIWSVTQRPWRTILTADPQLPNLAMSARLERPASWSGTWLRADRAAGFGRYEPHS